MTEYTHNDMEIKIYNGLISLINEGVNPYTVTVSSIAKSANIGKGTIYEYFSSKEEVISKSIIYFVDKEFNQIYDRIRREETFKNKIYCVFNIIEETHNTDINGMRLTFSPGGLEEFYTHISNESYDIDHIRELHKLISDDILDIGIDEGKIGKSEDKIFQYIGLSGIVTSFSHFLKYKKADDEKNIMEVKQMCYKMIIKLLE